MILADKVMIKIGDALYKVSDWLTMFVGLGTAADKMIYTTGEKTWAEADITAQGRAILDDADAAAQRATLGLTATATTAPALVGVGQQTINLLAAGMVKRTTNGPVAFTNEAATNDVMVAGYEFSASTAQAIQIAFPLPKSFDSAAGLVAKFYWTNSATAGTGDVAWAIRAAYVRDGDAIDSAWGTGQSVIDTFQTDGDLHITSETSTITPGGTYAAECMLWVEVYRAAAAGSDTYTETSVLVACMVQYTTAANTDD